jgi:hypothetical protein
MGCLATIGALFLFCFLFVIHPIFAVLFAVFLFGVAVGKKR